jgi:hypothetical protein
VHCVGILPWTDPRTHLFRLPSPSLLCCICSTKVVQISTKTNFELQSPSVKPKGIAKVSTLLCSIHTYHLFWNCGPVECQSDHGSKVHNLNPRGLLKFQHCSVPSIHTICSGTVVQLSASLTKAPESISQTQGDCLSFNTALFHPYIPSVLELWSS